MQLFFAWFWETANWNQEKNQERNSKILFARRHLSQSRSQSLRYPCPAERENEDLWEDAFELGISLVINGLCAVQPEVDKQLFCSQISNSKLAARDGFASSGYDRFEHERTKQSASTHKSTTRS